jgi:hypothetical protein
MARRLVILVTAVLLSAGCFVEVEDVSDPGPAFAKARAAATRVQGRPGPPGRLHVLVYDREEGQLVRASLPMWAVEKMTDEDVDLDLGDDEAERAVSRIRLGDLETAPLGPLVEVEEEDGDQVLVWLE